MGIKRKIAAALTLATLISTTGTTACNLIVPENTGKTEKTVKPASVVDDLFPTGDKEYFIPFQDPDKSYCTITEGLGTPVREQGMGGCYCYAAVSSMESNYLKTKGKKIDINPVDIINRIYSAPDPVSGEVPSHDEEKYYADRGPVTDLGGDINLVAGALCSDPLNGYLVSEANIYGCYNCDTPGLYEVSEDEIKSILKNNGAIGFCVNYTKDCKMVNGYYTQNHPNNAKDCNHVATLVGWDDDFPADCFKIPASRNGAWLVQNSFGEIWGNNGYYWVSYETPIPEIYNCSVTKDYVSAVSYGKYPTVTVMSPDVIEKTGRDINDTSITLNDVASLSKVEYATIFEQKGNVGAVGFWTDAPGTPYEILILDGEFGNVLASSSGTIEYAGYHTVKLDKPVSVKKYTVVVKTAGIGMFEGWARPAKIGTILGNVDGHYEAKSEPGRSFVKVGEDWVDVTDRDIKSRLGYDGIPAYNSFTTPGDPCITVLYV